MEIWIYIHEDIEGEEWISLTQKIKERIIRRQVRAISMVKVATKEEKQRRRWFQCILNHIRMEHSL